MSVAEAPRINMNPRLGRVTGASLGERCGLMAMRAAAMAVERFDDTGFSIAARVVSGLLPSDRAVRVTLEDDAVFEMPYGDAYWGVLLRPSSRYECDMALAMRAMADIDFVFIDCGANYGYWSVLLSSKAYGAQPVVAIEAAPDTFAWLQRNAQANDNRFAILNRAIAAHSGDTVAVHGAKHEARSIVDTPEEPTVGSVETLALDDLLTRPEFVSGRPIVIKLDVEGVEIAALEGAAKMLDGDVLLAYEDHGADPEHLVSRHIVETLGMRVFVIDEARAHEIDDFSQLDQIKKNPRRGYNFLATRSAFWASELGRLIDAGVEGRQ